MFLFNRIKTKRFVINKLSNIKKIPYCKTDLRTVLVVASDAWQKWRLTCSLIKVGGGGGSEEGIDMFIICSLDQRSTRE